MLLGLLSHLVAVPQAVLDFWPSVKIWTLSGGDQRRSTYIQLLEKTYFLLQVVLKDLSGVCVSRISEPPHWNKVYSPNAALVYSVLYISQYGSGPEVSRLKSGEFVPAAGGKQGKCCQRLAGHRGILTSFWVMNSEGYLSHFRRKLFQI